MDDMSTRQDRRNDKPATAARIYDYILGGVHNFPADQEAARKLIAELPVVPAAARVNRAVLRRMVAYLAGIGVQQFLDVGSGMPTESNVHEIAQQLNPEARVVYVDIDPVAVSESLEILDGNKLATAVHGNLRAPHAILDNPQVREMLDFDQPIALMLMAMLHFVPDADAYEAVSQLIDGLPPGSHLALTHGATETVGFTRTKADGREIVEDLYQQKTATPFGLRSWEQTSKFFEHCTLVDPGLVWMTQWRPTPDDPNDFVDDPRRCTAWAGLGKVKH
jgi:S-adenosyl methyltransferase